MSYECEIHRCKIEVAECPYCMIAELHKALERKKAMVQAMQMSIDELKQRAESARYKFSCDRCPVVKRITCMLPCPAEEDRQNRQ